MNFPNFKKGFRWGLSSGVVCAILFFAYCYFLSKTPAASEVSISLAFQPWWKFWETAVAIFFAVALVVGILAAVRPNLTKSDNQLSKH